MNTVTSSRLKSYLIVLNDTNRHFVKAVSVRNNINVTLAVEYYDEMRDTDVRMLVHAHNQAIDDLITFPDGTYDIQVTGAVEDNDVSTDVFDVYDMPKQQLDKLQQATKKVVADNASFGLATPAPSQAPAVSQQSQVTPPATKSVASLASIAKATVNSTQDGAQAAVISTQAPMENLGARPKTVSSTASPDDINVTLLREAMELTKLEKETCQLKVGDKVAFDAVGRRGWSYGTVKWLGHLDDERTGKINANIFAGLETELGNHSGNGVRKGVRLFDAPKGYAVFVPLESLVKREDTIPPIGVEVKKAEQVSRDSDSPVLFYPERGSGSPLAVSRDRLIDLQGDDRSAAEDAISTLAHLDSGFSFVGSGRTSSTSGRQQKTNAAQRSPDSSASIVTINSQRSYGSKVFTRSNGNNSSMRSDNDHDWRRRSRSNSFSLLGDSPPGSSSVIGNNRHKTRLSFLFALLFFFLNVMCTQAQLMTENVTIDAVGGPQLLVTKDRENDWEWSRIYADMYVGGGSSEKAGGMRPKLFLDYLISECKANDGVMYRITVVSQLLWQ